jgi:hypothetical protein
MQALELPDLSNVVGGAPASAEGPARGTPEWCKGTEALLEPASADVKTAFSKIPPATDDPGRQAAASAWQAARVTRNLYEDAYMKYCTPPGVKNRRSR